MRASNTALFDLAPDGAGTRVTWAMEGKETLLTKLMHVVLNMDKLVGKGRFRFIGFPLKIRGGTASPIRAVAIIGA